MHTFRLRIGFEFQTLRIRGSMTSFMRKVSIALETSKCCATSEHFPLCGHTLYTYILIEVKRSNNEPEVYRTFSKKEHRKRKRSRTRLVGEREWSAGERRRAARCIARAKVAVVGAATARQAASDQTWRHGRRKPTAFIVTLHFKFKRKLTRGLGQCAALAMTLPHGNRWHCLAYSIGCILKSLNARLTA